MNVEQIKKHPFFYGVDWVSIRNIEAPFIPRLKSITDTSYFPTDELEQVPDEPVGGDVTGAHKELAFLGYVVGFVTPWRSRADAGPGSFSAVIRSKGSRILQTLSDLSKDTFSHLWPREDLLPIPLLLPPVLSSPNETRDNRQSPTSTNLKCYRMVSFPLVLFLLTLLPSILCNNVVELTKTQK